MMGSDRRWSTQVVRLLVEDEHERCGVFQNVVSKQTCDVIVVPGLCGRPSCGKGDDHRHFPCGVDVKNSDDDVMRERR